MHLSSKTLSERARQLTREFLEPHTGLVKGAAQLNANGSQALSIVNLELTRLALSCQHSEEKTAIVEGFSKALAQLQWNAEDAATLVRHLENQLIPKRTDPASSAQHQ